MSYVSKEIYRKINNLFPDLQQKKPFTATDFKIKGANINMVVLDSAPEEINFVLNRYGKGQLSANLSIEICVEPKEKKAYVKTYKDSDYFHSAIAEPSDIATVATSQVNHYLSEWLKNLKNWDRSKSSNYIRDILNK